MTARRLGSGRPTRNPRRREHEMPTDPPPGMARPSLDELLAAVVPVDEGAAEAARRRWDSLAKPPGSLGRLEEIGVVLAGIARRPDPRPPARAALVVCAGDHGVVASGASAWPPEVTTAMVETICSGRAAASALAAVAGCDVRVLDVGVAGEPAPHARLDRERVRAGTGDISRTAAMSRAEAAAAVLAGARAAARAAERADVLLCGDMGIGNTTAAAGLVAGMTGADPAAVTGAGAGGGPEHVARKTELVRRAVALHRPGPDDPLGALAAVGGLEHAALAGLILGGARARRPVILDGVSTVAAALVAVALAPAAGGYLIAAHRSTEPGASVALEALRLRPLLELEMRLGEGTGALLALPLVRAAAAALSGMAALDEVAGAR